MCETNELPGEIFTSVACTFHISRYSFWEVVSVTLVKEKNNFLNAQSTALRHPNLVFFFVP